MTLAESGKCPHNAPMRFETIVVHASEPDAVTGAVAPPIHLATTFTRDADLALTGAFQYGREGGPTHAQLEGALARVEEGRAALVFDSGMAAGIAILEGLAPGDRVLLPDDAAWFGICWGRDFGDVGRDGTELRHKHKDLRRGRAARLGRHADACPLRYRRPHPAVARSCPPAVIPAAHHPAHVAGAGLVARLHPRLCAAGGQGTAARPGDDPAARHPAVDPDPRLPVDHRHRLHRAVPGQPAGRGMRGDLRRSSRRRPGTWRSALYQSLRTVPARPAGGGGDVPALGLAAVLAAGAAVRRARRCSGT